MIIKSIHLQEGLFKRDIFFSTGINLIHSERNSCGKTTLLRFILYGLGYNIPNTRNIKFDGCNVVVKGFSEIISDFELHRKDKDAVVLINAEYQETFVLPEQHNELLQKLFNTDNSELLENLLGAFYVDQEKGWTLLNRGVVIGSNRFNIEQLIRGLSNIDCTSLIKEQKRLIREKGKYLQMRSVAEYKASLEDDANFIVSDNYEQESNVEISKLLLKQRQLKSEQKRIDRTLSDNKKFIDFVEGMKLLIKAPDGTILKVTRDMIVGIDDLTSILISKRKMITEQLIKINNKIDALEKEQNSETEQLSFFENASQLEIFDKRIMRMNLNQQTIKKEIKRLEAEIKFLSEKISKLTKSDTVVVKSIADNIIKYCSELGIEGLPQTYLFTSNLKELSGAMLHKIAFAFRIAYLIEIEKKLNVKLPIILDSPSGKEVDQENIALMMNILKRDFFSNQIIIASIYKYDFDNLKIIELTDRLINETVANE